MISTIRLSCQKYVLPQIKLYGSVYPFYFSTKHYARAWNFILMHELPFLPANWSDVFSANKQRTADRHV